MSRRWLTAALLLTAACTRTNPENCRVTPSACTPAELCDATTERCIDPGLIDCAASCPTGSVCNQQTNRCEVELRIDGIDKPYIDSRGGETVTISGARFYENSEVFFDGIRADKIAYIDSGHLQITTPARVAESKRCGRLPLTINNPDNTTKTAQSFFAYYVHHDNFKKNNLALGPMAQPEQLVLSDLNRDGFDDLVVLRSGTSPALYFGSDSGPVDNPKDVISVVASQLVPDVEPQKTFLLAVDSGSPWKSYVYELNSMGGFPLLPKLNLPIDGSMTPITSIVAADLDGNDTRDTVLLRSSGALTTVIRGKDWSTAGLQAEFMSMELTPTTMTAGRYYGNATHIVAAAGNVAKLALIRYDAMNNTMSADSTLPLPVGASRILDGDVNGDGKKDLIVVQGNGEIRIFRNDDGFNDLDRQDVAFARTPTVAAVGDFDCDGRTDLVGLGNKGSDLTLYLAPAQQGGNVFPISLGLHTSRFLAVGDVNGDGVGEIVVWLGSMDPMIRYGLP